MSEGSDDMERDPNLEDLAMFVEDSEGNDDGARMEKEDLGNMGEGGNEIRGKYDDQVEVSENEGEVDDNNIVREEEGLDFNNNAPSEDNDVDVNEPHIYDNYDGEGADDDGNDVEATDAEDEVEREVEVEAYVAEFFEAFELDDLLDIASMVPNLGMPLPCFQYVSNHTYTQMNQESL